MTTQHRSLWIGGLALAALAVAMGLTNPSQSAYERYATDRLTAYASDKLCANLPGDLTTLLGKSCTDLLRQNQDWIAATVNSQTQRHNYWLFSLYQTTLALPGLPTVPGYRVKTIGVFGQFLTVQATRMAP